MSRARSRNDLAAGSPCRKRFGSSREASGNGRTCWHFCLGLRPRRRPNGQGVHRVRALRRETQGLGCRKTELRMAIPSTSTRCATNRLMSRASYFFLAYSRKSWAIRSKRFKRELGPRNKPSQNPQAIPEGERAAVNFRFADYPFLIRQSTILP